MAGISDKAAGGLENRYKYNGIELDTSLGLNEYEASLRDLDPQTGRWCQIDPETEDQEMQSPYASNNDNPIRYDDPKGNEGDDCCGSLLGAIVKATEEVVVGALSAANAVATNQVGGAGRADPNGYSDPDLKTSAQIGATTGDLVTLGVAALENIGYATGTVGSGGTLALTPATALTVQQDAVAIPAAIKNLKNDFAANNNSSSSNSRQSTPSKVEKSKTTETVGKKFTKTTETRPSKESPGQSRAEIIKYKNSDGKTIKVVKDSYDRGNKFQHRKIKFPNS